MNNGRGKIMFKPAKKSQGWISNTQAKQLAADIAVWHLSTHHDCSVPALYETNNDGNESLKDEYQDDFASIYDGMEWIISKNIDIR